MYKYIYQTPAKCINGPDQSRLVDEDFDEKLGKKWEDVQEN